MSTRYVQILEPDGTPTGATFAVERIADALTIRYDSRGTTEGTRAYRRGMVLLLQRLSAAAVTVTDACIETRTTTHLSRSARRLNLPDLGWPMLVQASNDEEADAIRALIHTAASRAGRAPGAKGGGNGTKRLRLYLKTRYGADTIERRVSTGAVVEGKVRAS